VILGLISPEMLGSLAGYRLGGADGSHVGAGGHLLLLDKDSGLVTLITSVLAVPTADQFCHQGVAQTRELENVRNKTINISPFSANQVALVSHQVGIARLCVEDLLEGLLAEEDSVHGAGVNIL